MALRKQAGAGAGAVAARVAGLQASAAAAHREDPKAASASTRGADGRLKRPASLTASSNRSYIRPLAWLRALRALVLQAVAAAVLLAAALGSTAALFLSTDVGQLALSHFSLRHPEAAEALEHGAVWVTSELSSLRELAVPVAEAFWAAARETSEAFAAWGRVAVLVGGHMLRGLCRVVAWAAPYAADAVAWAVRFQLSLPAPILLAEAALAGLVAFSVWFKKYLTRKQYLQRLQRHIAVQRRRLEATYRGYEARWVALKAEVAAKSRVAAAMLPHLLYAATAALLMIFCPSLTAAVASKGRGTLMYSAPLVMSIWALMDDGGSSSDGRSSSSSSGDGLRHRLMYWTVYAAFSAGRDVWTALPVVSRAAAWVPRPEEATFFAVLWMLMPFGGLQSIFRATVMSLRSYVGATPQFQSGTGVVARARSTVSTVISQLAALRIISEGTARLVVENLIDGASLSVGLLFLFTPSFMTRIGVAYVGYFVPINATLRSLSSDGTGPSRVFWLKYWVVQVPYTLLFHELYRSVSWVPLLPIDQVNLLVLLWLQLPYFRGTETVCRLATHEIAALLHAATDLQSPTEPPVASSYSNRNSNDEAAGVDASDEAQDEPASEEETKKEQ